MARLLPFLKERSYDGRFVLCNKGPMARHIQEVMGDVLMNSDANRMWSVEIKIEEANTYGNLFLETWSNLNLDDPRSHAERGSNPGWLIKLRAELLLYYFLQSDELYVVDLFKLKRWLLRPDADGIAPIDRFPQKRQNKRYQRNDTWGKPVPIRAILEQDIGLKRIIVGQLSLLPDSLTAA